MAKIVILDGDTMGYGRGAEWNGFRGLGEVELYGSTPYRETDIIERCEGAEVVIVNKVPISGKTIESLPQLRYIGLLATGMNNIDLEAAKARGIVVRNVPAYSTDIVAQHAVALILELCHRIGDHNQSVQRGDWVRSPHFCYWLQAPLELSGSTVGLVGLGEIGSGVAKRLLPFGVRILAWTPSKRGGLDDAAFGWADSLDSLFRQSDIVSLHCPQTSENAGLVNRERLALMKDGAYLVNTARGGLVDEEALAEALKSGKLGGAALDVVKKEPMEAGCPLLNVPNCIITPHIGWASEISRRRLMERAVQLCAEYLQKQIAEKD